MDTQIFNGYPKFPYTDTTITDNTDTDTDILKTWISTPFTGLNLTSNVYILVMQVNFFNQNLLSFNEITSPLLISVVLFCYFFFSFVTWGLIISRKISYFR